MPDLLFEDPEIISQKFCLLSFVSPESNQKHALHALKVRGVYETKEDACRQAEYLRNLDSDFDIFVAQIGRWLPWYPDVKSIPETQYQQTELNSMVENYKKAKKNTDQEFQLRKQELSEKARKEGQSSEKIVDEKTIVATVENIEGCIREMELKKRGQDEELKELKERLVEYNGLLDGFKK